MSLDRQSPVATFHTEFRDKLRSIRPMHERERQADSIRVEAASEFPVGTWVMVPCYDCDGRPAGNDGSGAPCVQCSGAGWVNRQVLVCSDCKGEGIVEVPQPPRNNAQLEQVHEMSPCLYCAVRGKVVAYYPEGDG